MSYLAQIGSTASLIPPKNYRSYPIPPDPAFFSSYSSTHNTHHAHTHTHTHTHKHQFHSPHPLLQSPPHATDMTETTTIAFNTAAFLSALFLLESGADRFINHTAIVARRAGVSETLIGLLTAGGEWEELAVVAASLAVGNVVGAGISNILGAFSLGLIFYGYRGAGGQRGDHGEEEDGVVLRFDRSARIYSVGLLVLTTFVLPVVYFLGREKGKVWQWQWRVGGGVLVVLFVGYVVMVGIAIGRGVLDAPEGSDSGSDSDYDNSVSSDGESNADDSGAETTTTAAAAVDPTTPLLPRPRPPHNHSLLYHVSRLGFGFLAICLAGYTLSESATNLTDQLGISDVLFGVVVLSIATTLPEKMIAVMSGHRGHAGILVANCVGSNIFLLTLCLGIVLLGTSGEMEGGDVAVSELATLWVATLGVAGTVWFEANIKAARWIGAVMVVGYVVFIVLEFVVVHRV